MRSLLAIGAVALSLNAFVAAAEQPPPLPATPKPSCDDCALKDKPAATLAKAKPAAPPPENPLASKSEGFWGDWKTTQASQSFTALKTAVAGAHTSPAPAAVPAANAPPPPAKQKIIDVAVTKPEYAAKLLTAASAASADQTSTEALATVLTMMASPKTLEAAAPFIAPEAQASAQAMTANLSTGIQGLPGIYLSDQPIESSVRSAAPAGYEPVSGGSMGCPAGN
ncbi:MAG: hypothetical protein KBA31_10025 [Alphaproteobacteria bacterium]|nr:hypothetical protein [Alphaproteobacteria bacterium]